MESCCFLSHAHDCLFGQHRAAFPKGGNRNSDENQSCNIQPQAPVDGDPIIDATLTKEELLEKTKERVKDALDKPEYDVKVYYSDTGAFQKIARHPIFEKVTLFVIMLNALWIAYDSDANEADTIANAKLHFQIAENLFCIFFTVEWCVRFMAFKRKMDCFKDGWFVFDSVLVATMVLETWVMFAIEMASGSGTGAQNPVGNSALLRIARLLRLSRMARMGRLLRAFPELLIQIKGIAGAARSVMVTLTLLIMVLYVFAIAFRQLLSGTEVGDKHFPSMPRAMFTLLIYGTFMEDLAMICDAIRSQDPFCFLVFLLFVLASALTVTNMLIGVLCEVVSNVAAEERERLLLEWVRDELQRAMKKLDKSEDGELSKSEFLDIFKDDDTCMFLTEVGVDVVGLVEFVDFIFDDTTGFHTGEKQLTFNEFMEVVLSLRGTNQATVRDVVDLRKFVRAQMRDTNLILDPLLSSIESHVGALTKSGGGASRPSNAPPMSASWTAPATDAVLPAANRPESGQAAALASLQQTADSLKALAEDLRAVAERDRADPRRMDGSVMS